MRKIEYFYSAHSAFAYIGSIYAGLLTALWPFLKTYGPPRGWRPHPTYMWRMLTRGRDVPKYFNSRGVVYERTEDGGAFV